MNETDMTKMALPQVKVKNCPVCFGARDVAFGIAAASLAAHRLHKLSLLPLLLPHIPPVLLSLTLTQRAISVVGGFYLYSEARCRHGEGCSSLEDNGLVRLYASETPHLRPAQLRSLLPRPHARSEASELAAYQSTTARFSGGAFVSARMGPAWHKRRSRYNERAQPQTRLLICQHDVTSW